MIHTDSRLLLSRGIVTPSALTGDAFTGVGALQSRQALMVDAVDAMTVQAYLRASGFTSDYSLQRSSTAIEQQWTFQPLPGSQQA